MYAETTQKAYYDGLQTCGSAWVCPTCGGAIWDVRKDELRQALEVHRGRGGAVLFITLTASHEHLPLKLFLAGLKRAMRRVYSGRQFQAFKARLGYIGAVRGTEVTWSPLHGWHPHFHLLWFCSELTADELADVQQLLTAAWLDALAAEGLQASGRRGVVVKESSWSIEEYITKCGHERHWDADAELTMGQRKQGKRRGLSPHDFLRVGLGQYEGPWRVDPERAAALYREYAAGTKGLHSLRWSPGLRELLGLAAELSDEAIAAGGANELDVYRLGSLNPRQWRVVLANDARGELVEAAGRGDAGAFLLALGADWTPAKHPAELYLDEIVAAMAEGP
jgi:hypothetical protein